MNYLVDKECQCAICDQSEKMSELLACSSCGQHYHASCLSLKLEGNAIIRLGWQCPECKTCQSCQKTGDDSKMLVCDTCDKGYHTYCMRPQLTTIPTNGWKCVSCRQCAECHIRGANFAADHSKWHLNYSICDTCFQSKTKPPAILTQFVDFNQDSKSSLNEDTLSNMDSEASSNATTAAASALESSSSSIPLSFASVSKENRVAKPPMSQPQNGKKKQIPSKKGRGNRRAALTDSNQGKNGVNLRARSTRSKRMGSNEASSSSLLAASNELSSSNIDNQPIAEAFEPTIGHIKRDEDDHHAVTVLVGTDDSFTLFQDMCLSCGSFGKHEEGHIVSCSQCGQSYHSYCAGVNKVSRVMLERGWRCLDCTICEGCGKATDEGRLLLCDDCDISYHLYCLDPPLDQVPEGIWKCKWCTKCGKCGSRQPGPAGSACEWMSNYSECALCHSMHTCASCLKGYKQDEIILKCEQCERWTHGACGEPGVVLSEEDAERLANDGFYCNACKVTLKHLNEPQCVPDVNTNGVSTTDVSPDDTLAIGKNFFCFFWDFFEFF